MMSVIRFKMRIGVVITLLLVLSFSEAKASGIGEDPEKPQNVLVIFVDDLNDWVGCLGGHPQVKTPNIDRLARKGVLFANAHAQAAMCGPSRTSMLSGLMPQTSGARGFEQYWTHQALEGHLPLPMHFKQEGYTTYGGGKIFSNGFAPGAEKESWNEFLRGGGGPGPEKRIHNIAVHPSWDWSPIDRPTKVWGDYRLAANVAKVLEQPHEEPFLIMAGIVAPHVPLYRPKEWFDLYPLEDIKLPDAPADDLDDVPHPEMALGFTAEPQHEDVLKKDVWHSIVQAYLASVSFTDHCVGVMLDALEQGPNKENTIVVLLSDHGFHLGEKQHWGKQTLWEESTKVPLIIAGPGVASGRSEKPVGLIDLYPTLCEMTKQPVPDRLEGHSLLPLLKDPHAAWEHAAYTTHAPGDLAVRTEHWRYIRHVDGAEELYDHRKDPNEWNNLAGNAEYGKIKQRLAAFARQWE